MNHFALPRMTLRSWRWTTLTAVAGLSCALSSAGTAYAQAAAAAAPVTVAVTPAAFLPVLSGGSSQTTIATNLDGSAPTSPWQISLLSVARSPDGSGQTYQVQITNVSSGNLSLPVGTDGQAIWNACQNGEIDEVNITLQVIGQNVPAANLPAVHSCAGVPTSSLTLAPGGSVIFAGTVPNTLLAPDGASISAVVSVCSATYSADGSDPVAIRNCQVPMVSNLAAAAAPATGAGTQGGVVTPVVAPVVTPSVE